MIPYLITAILSPGQTFIINTYNIILQDPRRDTEVKLTSGTASVLPSALPDLTSQVRLDDKSFTNDMTIYDFLTTSVDDVPIESFASDLTLKFPFMKPVLAQYVVPPISDPMTLTTRHLLFPSLRQVDHVSDQLWTDFPQGCTAVATVWTTTKQALLLFVCWLLSMLQCCGFKLSRLKSTTQRSSLLPKTLRHAPGMPRRLMLLSTLTLSASFEHALTSGTIIPRKPKVRFRKPPSPSKVRDPHMLNFVLREAHTIDIYDRVHAKSPRFTSYSQFRDDLFTRCDAPERIRLLAMPRWSVRSSPLPVPNPAIISAIGKQQLLDPRFWTQGEWGSDWDPMSTVTSVTQAMLRLNNYSQFLPLNAVLGDAASRINQALQWRQVGLHCNTLAGFNACLSTDMDWIANLRSEFGNPEQPVFPIIIDSGASGSATPHKEDFIGPIEYGDFGTVQTADKDTKVEVIGRGLVRWTAIDALGRVSAIETIAHLVPGMTQQLLSPQDYHQFHEMYPDRMLFGSNATDFMFETKDGRVLRAPIDRRSNLPVLLCRRDLSGPNAPSAKMGEPCSCKQGEPSCTRGECNPSRSLGERNAAQRAALRGYASVLDETNQNLTSAQKELLLWHQRLGHISFRHVQILLSRCTDALDDPKSGCDPCIPTKFSTAASCDPPLCAACELARARRKGDGSHSSTKIPDKINSVKGKKLLPGDLVSMDQYVCQVHGRLPGKRGRESAKYCGGTIFVDHASGFVHLEHQISFTAAETLRSKLAFEQEVGRCGRAVKAYRTDNGVFKSREFADELRSNGQGITFSATGAHFQNGVAERSIRLVVEKARAMMLHAQMHWPETFEMELWPWAMDYAVYLYNHTPTKDGPPPIEHICDAYVNCKHAQRARVWGCPAYVLDPKLRDGKTIPKWKNRANMGQFVGVPKTHSSTIGLIRNLRTEYVTPQWHVAYDERFTTVPTAAVDDDEIEALWIDIFNDTRDYYGDPDSEHPEDEPPELDDEWLEDDERAARRRRQRRVNNDNRDQQRNQDDSEDSDDDDDASGSDDDPPCPDDDPDEVEPIRPTPRNSCGVDDEDGHPNGGRRSSRRTRAPPDRLTPDWGTKTYSFGDKWTTLVRTPSSKQIAFRAINLRCSADVVLMNLEWHERATTAYSLAMQQHEHERTCPFTGEIFEWHPFILSAKANQEDYPTLREIFRLPQEEQEAWFDSMDVEIEGLIKKECFEVVDRSIVEAAGHEIVPTTWALRQKRLPDGTPTKRKARCCLRGDLQTGFNTRNDVYAPVVDWATVRLLFSLTLHQGYKTRQVDFRQAFIQSDLPEPIYAELPPGGWKKSNPGKVLKLKKSLYGDRRAPQLWFKHLKRGLEVRGWTQSKLDPCLFLRGDVLFTVYCDDGIFFAKNTADIERAIQSLSNPVLDNHGKQLDDGHAFDLEAENDLAGYLGVEMKREPDGSLHMSQYHLTKRIIAALGLEDANPAKTPASGTLCRDLDGPGRQEEWNMRSVIGMMMYLCNNTRCDIAFAVNQVARFANNPRRSHEVAVKRIAKYLKASLYTDDQGIERVRGTIFKSDPSVRLQMDMFCDSDFAGLHGIESQDDPSSARSRTGFVVMLGDLPLLWQSKLQTCQALSTAESEYAALSSGMRALLPLRHILFEVADCFKIPLSRISTISHVFEDNEACISVATADPPRLTARNKHWNVKHHWFRSHLGVSDGVGIKVLPVSSASQRADTFTKALPEQTFVDHRKHLLGW